MDAASDTDLPTPLAVQSRDSLATAPDTAVRLGDAPDGLPLVLAVSRRRPVRDAVLAALADARRDDATHRADHPVLSASIAAALDALEAACDDDASARGVERIQSARVYRSAATVGALLGDTLLARCLGSHSPLAPDHASSGGSIRSATTRAGAESPVTVMKGMRTRRFLAVPDRDGPVFLVEAVRGQLDPDSLQPFRFEDLRGLPSARYAIDGDAPQGPLADADGYLHALARSGAPRWWIAARDIGDALVGIARSVQALHDEGRVHADLKPGNAVIAARGPVAIDPLGVAAGAVAPGATPGWAAPEQILGQPVTPATDVYALGLMLAQLLGAVIYGREQSFRVPADGARSQRVHLLTEPEVLIDAHSGEPDGEPRARATTSLPDDMRDYWCGLIRRCVTFDPEARPQSAAAWADEVDTMLAEEPLVGDLVAPGGPGALRRLVRISDTCGPAWVISDLR